MPNRYRTILSCSLVLLPLTFLNGCETTSTDNIDVQAEWAPGVIIDVGKYYDWFPDLDETRPTPVEPEMDAFVRTTIERELSRRGFIKRADNHSIEVAYDIGTRSVLESPFQGAAVREEGALGIMLIDPEKRVGVWRGVAKAPLETAKSPADRRARIQRAVRSIVAKLPRAGR